MKMIEWMALALMAGTATANARDLSRQPYPMGERAFGMGGAFISLTGDPTSAYYNPAGLAGLRSRGVSISASAYQYAIETYTDVFELALPDQRYTADMRSAKFSTFPSSLVYVKPLGKPSAESPTRHVLAFAVLLPDNDSFDGRLNANPTQYAFQMNAIVGQQDATYWAGPAYGYESGALRLGVSVFALAHFTDRKFNVGLQLAQDAGPVGNTNFFAAEVLDISALGVTAVAQAGVQYSLNSAWTIGWTARSPTLGNLYSSGEGVVFSSAHAEEETGETLGASHVDRLELKNIQVDYRLPFMTGLGISVQKPKYTLALDASVHLAVHAYADLTTDTAVPRQPDGTRVDDPDRQIDPSSRVQASWLWNVNLGMEYIVSPTLQVRGGLFTDHSAVDQAFHDASAEARADAVHLPRVNHYGMSFSVGSKGDRTTTTVGFIYRLGKGETYQLSELLGEPARKADVTTHTLTAVLAGSADF